MKGKPSRTHLARRHIQRLEYELNFAGARTLDFPDLRLEGITRTHGRRKAHTKERKGARVTAANGSNDRASGEAEGGEAVEDDAAEASGLPDAGV